MLMKVEVIKRRAKSLYTRSRIPGVSWSANQYVGCSFACPYCYAKNVVREFGEREWGSWVIAKINAPELARKHVSGKIVMSTVSDPYQPVEAKLKLTRATLRFMDKRNELSILTKSPLVTRDIALFKLFRSIEVGLTLNSFDGREKSLLEPLTPVMKARVNALQKLHEEGIRTYTFVSPIIPGVTDVSRIVKETRGFVDYYFFEVLNLKKAGNEFQETLRSEFPESYCILTSEELFGAFISELRDEVRSLGIKTEGIETHFRGWGFVRI
ncbi:Radical SAM domain protein [Thermococcus gammatolerans EJ3]|uniref:Radical SAM domain protein n=2 Tax=Thermococcus TaxID=2263 RepID=C5A4X0_THEGJ|nr:Radical SAM domain protein [Thermococcus gammatolerans EJ3]